MNGTELLTLVLLCSATSFTPGPNTTLSATLAVHQGWRVALRFVLSVPVGWGLLLGLCSAGVGSLVAALPPLRLAVKLLGVGYLLWLAYRLMRSSAAGPASPKGLRVGFIQGVMLQFLNIKVWMLALTVVAGWLAGHTDAGGRFAVVLAVMLSFALSSNLCYALAGSLLREWLTDAEHGGRRLRWFNRSMGLILLGTALWMAAY